MHDRAAPRFWDHQYHPLKRLHEGILRALTSPLVGRHGIVVDMGCGSRPYERLLRSHGFDYIGCDIGEDAEVTIVPGQPVPLAAGSATGVVSFQVLEHVWDLDWYLGECRRLVAADGWLLLSTHGSWPFHPHPADYRRWTRDGLEHELSGRGFRVVHTQSLLGPLGWTTQFRALGIRELLIRSRAPRPLIPTVMMLMNSWIALQERVTPARIVRDNACIYVTLCSKSERATARREPHTCR